MPSTVSADKSNPATIWLTLLASLILVPGGAIGSDETAVSSRRP
jgi:hypothetical protein